MPDLFLWGYLKQKPLTYTVWIHKRREQIYLTEFIEFCEYKTENFWLYYKSALIAVIVIIIVNCIISALIAVIIQYGFQNLSHAKFSVIKECISAKQKLYLCIMHKNLHISCHFC